MIRARQSYRKQYGDTHIDRSGDESRLLLQKID